MTNPRFRRLVTRSPRVTDAPYTVDTDVAAEAARIDAAVGARGEAQDRLRLPPGAPGSSDVVIINHLRKVYGDRKVAVRDLSFGVQSGQVRAYMGVMLCVRALPSHPPSSLRPHAPQIFGFLGINGAGGWRGRGASGFPIVTPEPLQASPRRSPSSRATSCPPRAQPGSGATPSSRSRASCGAS